MVKSAVIKKNNIRRHEGSTYKNYLTNQHDCTFAFHLINNDTLHIIKKTLRYLTIRVLMAFPKNT